MKTVNIRTPHSRVVASYGSFVTRRPYSAYSVTVNSLAPDPNELNRLANTAADHQDIRNEQMMQQQRRGVEVASRQRASRTKQTR